MVGTRDGVYREDFAHQGAEASFHAVANDRIADFLGHSEADTDERIFIAARANEQDEAGRRRALATIGGKEVRAFRENS